VHKTPAYTHVHNHYWSGVFNLLKFDRTPKKKKVPRSQLSFLIHYLM